MFVTAVADGRFALLSDDEVIAFSEQVKTRKPETTKHDAKGLQEIYRNGTRNRNRGYYTGGTVRNHEIFRALCPKLKNVEELPSHQSRAPSWCRRHRIRHNRTSLANLLFLLFSLFFCPFVSYCFTSTVSCTPSSSPIEARHLSAKK